MVQTRRGTSASPLNVLQVDPEVMGLVMQWLETKLILHLFIYLRFLNTEISTHNVALLRCISSDRLHYLCLSFSMIKLDNVLFLYNLLTKF